MDLADALGPKSTRAELTRFKHLLSSLDNEQPIGFPWVKFEPESVFFSSLVLSLLLSPDLEWCEEWARSG